MRSAVWSGLSFPRRASPIDARGHRVAASGHFRWFDDGEDLRSARSVVPCEAEETNDEGEGIDVADEPRGEAPLAKIGGLVSQRSDELRLEPSVGGGVDLVCRGERSPHHSGLGATEWP